nr:MAG TPA: hypothetical protein [Caudoviricetes sp.]
MKRRTRSMPNGSNKSRAVKVVSQVGQTRSGYKIFVNMDVTDEQLRTVRERQAESARTLADIQRNYDRLSGNAQNAKMKAYGSSD